MSTVEIGWWVVQAPKFATSWEAADAEYLVSHGEELLTRTGAGRPALLALIADLTAGMSAVAAKSLEASLARGQRDGGKNLTRTSYEGWQKAVAYNLSDSYFAGKAPNLPGLADSEKQFCDKLDAALALWDGINAATDVPGFTPPLLTRSGLTRAAFGAQVAALETAYKDTPVLEQQASLLRTRRDQIAVQIHDLCVAYRAAVENAFEPTDPVRLNLPILSPKSSHTPGAVTLTAVYDPATGTTALTWTPSTEPDLARYSVRICAGPRYKADDEATIADIAAGTTSFTIPAIYLPEGASVWAKLVVILGSGNEKGSDAVKVSAPG